MHAADNVLELRSLADAQAIQAVLAKVKQQKSTPEVVILGASFIGLELASTLHGMGCAVTLVDQGKLPLAGPLGEAVGEGIAQLLYDTPGVRYLAATSIDTFCPREHAVQEVSLSNGEMLCTDLVVLGIGVQPRFPKVVGAQVHAQTGALVADKQQRIAPNVWAAGDCAGFPYAPTREEHVNIGHWSVAMNLGRTAALNMLDKPTVAFEGKWPFFWSAFFDRKIKFFGRLSPSLTYTSIIEGDPHSATCLVLYVSEATDEVHAVCGVGAPGAAVVPQCSVLMHAGHMPKGAALQQGGPSEVIAAALANTRTC